MQLSHFLWIASVSFSHQKCFAAIVILFILVMAACLLYRNVITVVRRLAGTITFSSNKTSPYLVDKFRLYWLYSSAKLSYCFLSKHTRVFSSFGSLVVFVISSSRSVASCFSVSLTVFSWSQLCCSIACILGA